MNAEQKIREAAEQPTSTIAPTSSSEVMLDPDLSILKEGRREPPALNLDPFGPDCRYWLLSAAEDRGSPVDYIAMALLSVESALLGNVRWVSPWGSWKEPPTIWMAQVGYPSSGKSPGQDAVREPLGQLESSMADGYPDHLREWRTKKEEAKIRREDWENIVKESVKTGKTAPMLPENAVEPEKPQCPRVMIVDATPEAVAKLAAAQPRGLLSHRDELAGMIGNFDRYNGAGGERAFWLEAFGGRKFVVDRKKEDQPLVIPHLSISILGGLQPDRLATLLLSGDDDGLASRFLYTWPDPVEPMRPKGTLDGAIVQRVMSRLWELPMATDENGIPCPRIVSLSDEAAGAFQEWRSEHSKEMIGGMIGGHFGKMPGLLLRLSLNLEFLWWASNPELTPEPETVGVKALAYAVFLIEEYFKPMAQRCFGDAALPESERLAATVARWIVKERPDKVNVRNLHKVQRLPGLREPAKAQKAVDELEASGWLIQAPSRDGSNPGRPKSDYSVNPKILEQL
jgi:hypothetical protein